MAKNGFRIDGMKELQRSIEKLGKVPQKHVNSAARKGVELILKSARANAPFDTGQLKSGIIKVPERNHSKSKKVYRLVFDRAKNDIFQKTNAEGKVTGYYPVSQEYGYFTVNGRYIPGFRFIHFSFNQNAKKMADVMVVTMKKKIDQEIVKVGLN